METPPENLACGGTRLLCFCTLVCIDVRMVARYARANMQDGSSLLPQSLSYHRPPLRLVVLSLSHHHHQNSPTRPCGVITAREGPHTLERN